MAEPLPESPDIAPRRPGNRLHCSSSKPDRGFADDLEFAFYYCNSLGIGLEPSRSMPAVNCSIMPIASRMSRNAVSASLKGKHRLAGCSFPYSVPQRFCRSEIDRCSQNVCQAILQPDHIEKRELPRVIEFRH